jgi:hypothetical protein
VRDRLLQQSVIVSLDATGRPARGRLADAPSPVGGGALAP